MSSAGSNPGNGGEFGHRYRGVWLGGNQMLKIELVRSNVLRAWPWRTNSSASDG